MGTISIDHGTVRLPAALVDACFPRADAVAILIDGRSLRIVPLHEGAAGGCLLKRRNAAGDRIASAFDLFEHHGLADCVIERLPACWSPAAMALVAELPTRTHT